MSYETDPKIIHKYINVPDVHTIGVYEEKAEGYAAWRKALSEYEGADVLGEVKAASLGGRGGAWFPTGMKWSFMPAAVFPKYLVCNCDESEPGTFSNREIVLKTPHTLLEGFMLGCYAIGCTHGYIYVRGEMMKGYARLRAALAEAKARGYVGKNILGSGFDLEITIHTGAGAYICGEETALLSSLEGDRGQPRLKPPFPAVAGLYAKPTSVNNVETLSNLPYIIREGSAAFKQFGTERSPGMKIVSVSGHVEKPGNYEVPVGTPISTVLALAGGVQGGKKLKGFFPGGSSTPMMGPDKVDTPLDPASITAAGSILGTAGLCIFDEDTDIVHVAARLIQFYKHESCGKCTPCREGNDWLMRVLQRLDAGKGKDGDLDMLIDMSSNIAGRSFCLLGDAATTPVVSSIKTFRDDFEKRITNPADERIFIPLVSAHSH
ncbi:MAG TPA: NADH-quinone oxidoreductase subunit NuoF [Abditibacteriaceae bacterium]|jgi:NADH-quinone oxidoreductase subunit F